MTSAGRSAALLFVAVAGGAMLLGALPISAGLIGAPALAAIAVPVQRQLSRHIAPRVAALLLVVVTWIALVLPAAWMVHIAIHQAPAGIAQVRHALEHVPTISLGGEVLTVDTLVARAGAQTWGVVTSSIGPALGTVVHVVTDLSIALIGLFFLLLNADAAWKAARDWLPFSPDGNASLERVFVSVTRATVLGSLTSSALQGLSIGVGLWLTGNGAPAFWGMVAAFSTLVPIVGNAIIWVPAVVTEIVRGIIRRLSSSWSLAS
jgi:predicted PurR-regulated permease PerM